MHTPFQPANTLHKRNALSLYFGMEPQKLKYLVTDFTNDAIAGNNAKKQKRYLEHLGYTILAVMRVFPALFTKELSLATFKQAFKTEILDKLEKLNLNPQFYTAAKQRFIRHLDAIK